MEKLFILTYMPLTGEYEATLLKKLDNGCFENWMPDRKTGSGAEYNDTTIFEYEEMKVFEDENGHKRYEFYTKDGEINPIEKEYFENLGVDYTVSKDENIERKLCTGSFVDKRKLIYD